jgi:hypothetical protein
MHIGTGPHLARYFLFPKIYISALGPTLQDIFCSPKYAHRHWVPPCKLLSG